MPIFDSAKNIANKNQEITMNERRTTDNREASEAQHRPAPAKTLAEAAEKLARYGGFDFLKMVIPTFSHNGKQFSGVQWFEKEAMEKQFLEVEFWKQDRMNLKRRLQLCREILANDADPATIATTLADQKEATGELRKKNLKIAADTIRDLEISWRTLASFFTNAESSKGEKIENITIINATMEQLKDKDSPIFLQKIAEELDANYNNMELVNSYTTLVIPGWLGSVQDVDRFAEVCAKNKVTLVTDFADAESVEDTLTMLEAFNLQSADEYKAHVVMTVNHIVARPPTEVDEVMYIPASAAVAGRMYETSLAQPIAGVTHGRLKEVAGVKFPIKQSEFGELGKFGVNPITQAFGKVFPMETKTLNNSDEPALKNYSIPRVHDFLIKTIKDMLNRTTFRNLTTRMKQEIKEELIKFFDKMKKETLIEDYEILSVKKIAVDKIHLKITVDYLFPVRQFIIDLSPRKLDDNTTEWD